MNVFFSTVNRLAPVERGGDLVRMNWEDKRVERAVPMVPRSPDLKDPNPRGGMRGGRGIQVFGDEVVAASYDTLRVFDQDLNHRRDISHALMAGIHETHPSGPNSLWATVTNVDAAIDIDVAGGKVLGQIWPRELPGLQQRLGLVPSQIDKEVADHRQFLSEELTKHPSHLHFNAVSSRDGSAWGLFSRFGAIVDLGRQEVVIEDPALMGGHNLVLLDEGYAFVNQTRGHGVRVYDLNTRRLVRMIDVGAFPWVRDLLGHAGRKPGPLGRLKRKVARRMARGKRPVARPLFMRGMSVADGRLFVGTSPASILCIDWQTGRLEDAFNYSKDVRVCVHGLKVVEGS